MNYQKKDLEPQIHTDKTGAIVLFQPPSRMTLYQAGPLSSWPCLASLVPAIHIFFWDGRKNDRTVNRLAAWCYIILCLAAERIFAGVAGVPELAGDGRHKAGHDGWAAVPNSRRFSGLVLSVGICGSIICL